MAAEPVAGDRSDVEAGTTAVRRVAVATEEAWMVVAAPAAPAARTATGWEAKVVGEEF